jgi:hypothetical protein
LGGFIFTKYAIKYWRKSSFTATAIIVAIPSILAMTKGNGLVLLIAAIGLIVLSSVNNKQLKLKTLLFQITLLVLSLGSIAYFGNYAEKHTKYDNAFKSNIPRQPKANFFREDTLFKGRKGLTTISETFFSFKLKSLLDQPLQHQWTY